MQAKKTDVKTYLTDTVYRNAYLLIISAWLFTLSFVFSNYWSQSTSPQGVKRSLERYLHGQEEDFSRLLRDTPLIRRLALNTADDAELQRMIELPYGVFIYEQGASGLLSLMHWNTQQSLPTPGMLEKPEGMGLDTLPNGQYAYIRKLLRGDGQAALLVCALIPVRFDYFIENDYLRKGFVDAPDVEGNYIITSDPLGIPVFSSGGQVMYRIERHQEADAGGSGWLTVLLRVLGTLLLLFYLHMAAQAVSKTYGAMPAVVFLVAAIALLRGLSYALPIPFDFSRFELFDPAIYGSNAFLKSLGDLLVNSLLFAWIMLFIQSLNEGITPLHRARGPYLRVFFAVIITCLLLATTWAGGDTIRSLVSDSAISYEVTNFFRLDKYTVVGFFVMGCISMGYYILSRILFGYLSEVLETSMFNKLLLTIFIGLSLITLFIDSRFVGFGMGLLLWLAGYLFLLKISARQGEHRITGNATVFWLIFFSASITAIIFTENRTRELGIRKAAAIKLAIQSDPSNDYLVNIAATGLGNDFLLSSLSRFRDPLVSVGLKDSIINANFRGYTNKFDTRLFLFDSSGKPLSASDQMTYDTLNTIFTLQGKKTAVPGMRYFENDFTSFSYIFRRTLRDSADSLVAVFYMLSNPRNFREEALYPELIRKTRETPIDNWPGYAYAVYDSLELQMNRNDYPFPVSISASDLPRNEFRNEVSDGYEVLWHRAGGGKVVVVTRKSNFILEAITLFAYLFCASLLLVGLFQTVSLIIRAGYEPGAVIEEIRNTSIRNQIYGTIIFLSIFSFLVVGVVTIVFFINRYDRNNRDMLSRTIQLMADEMQDRIGGRTGRNGFFSLTDSARLERLEQIITEISEIHNADINLYDERGDLLVSSQPFVYNEGILSRKMDPQAYHEMRRRRMVQFMQHERYGQLEYVSIYTPFRTRNQAFSAYVNIPYFASTRGLKQEISGFLVALINLNTFVFLMAGVISVIITNRITRSFSWIGRKMQEVNLGKHNEEISWDRKDEIGGLVEQYNRMVRKLEDSATALARTEREGAWREMARQVAHEIKNPLTPMKLSIQYLQKAIRNDATNVRELSMKVAGTLIEQIEHLSKIAAEFSEFANIGNLSNEHFDLHEVLDSLMTLHSLNEKVEISWHRPEGMAMVKADRTQMNRLFTNLLQNAIEAIPDDRQGVIRILEEFEDGVVRISVSDNGVGIPASMQSRIFTPNFTTKTSGTGLGLAMCKGIVEQARGEIWFETKAGEGTVFHISLPYEKG